MASERERTKTSKDTLNLEQVVKDWAMREYDRTANRGQRRLRQKEIKKNQKYIDLQIDWSAAQFNDTTKWSRLTAADESQSLENGPPPDAIQSQVATSPKTQLQFGSGRSSAPVTSILFETKFTNNTKDVQEYTMRTEKTTKSCLSTTIEKGLTRGFEMGIKLVTPGEVFEANAGFHREVTLTNIEGDTIEEELTWGVESLIRVKPEHVAEASLVVNERKQSGEFVIESAIRGMVFVTFTNIRENNSFIKETGHDIAAIVEEFLHLEARKERTLHFVRVENKVVTVTTSGFCNFRYGVSQEVKVSQRALAPDGK